MLWECFSAAGPRRLVKAEKYKEILAENLKQVATHLRLGGRFVFHQDNDPKPKAKSVQEWLQNNNVSVMEWPSQSPDLSPIENLLLDLKRTVHSRYPHNLNDFSVAQKNGGKFKCPDVQS